MSNPNGAKSIYGQVPGSAWTGGGEGIGKVDWDMMEAAFTYAIENFGVDWGDTVTTEQASELRQRVVVPRFEAAEKAPKVERVKGWFDRWYLWYPFVDRVAVQRAVDFDLDVWGEITARERHEVVVRLAKHPDPWAEGDIVRQPVTEGGVMVRWDVQPTTDRAARWASVDPAHRKALLGAVEHVQNGA